MVNIIENLKKNDKSPEYYQYYPRLFYNYFKEINNSIIHDLSNAGYLYYQSTLCTDILIDDHDYSKIPLILIFQEEAIKILTSIYGKNSEFWDYWNKRRNEYFEAVKIEKKLRDEKDINFSVYEDLSDKKSAFGKVAIDCLYTLSDYKDSKLYKTLLQSHYYFSVGFQLYDDVKDFKEDFEKGQFNWAIYELKNKISFSEYDNNVFILNKLLFLRGIGQELLLKSINYFKNSFEILEPLHQESEWAMVIKKMKHTIEMYLEVTVGYINTISKKIEVQNCKIKKDYFFDFSSVKNTTIKNGLEFIKKDFIHNFADLKHYMYISKNQGFENAGSVHYSDTFQRSMLNNCLLYIAKKFSLDISEYVKQENDYLIGLINKDTIGGWSYYPTVNEIAPDIDTLGEIMQYFIKSNNGLFVNIYCEPSIDIALKQRTQLDGGIETWIIPKNNQTKIQIKQEDFSINKWGVGPDLEIVANFIYSLNLYNPSLYFVNIENALKYIVESQNEKGFWAGRQYYGNYYSTYVVLRALKEYSNSYSKAIDKALEYIIGSKNEDGGYGLNENSDPLSTSFVLLSLKLFYKNSNSNIKQLEEYLRKKQNKEGFWSDVGFIKSKQNEAYKSKTLTTAFVLKSLCL